MDLQDVLRRLNQIDEWVRRNDYDVSAGLLISEIHDLIADIEHAIGEED